MNQKLIKLLERTPSTLRNSIRGIEREALRVTPEGHISEREHPRGLGAALTSKFITTDYSEAMVEIITPPESSLDKAYNWLKDIHSFAASKLKHGELLWNCSMPCIIDPMKEIPPAKFGLSDAAKFKELYRSGLKHRYGCKMQSIAGIHFNYSFSNEFWESLFLHGRRSLSFHLKEDSSTHPMQAQHNPGSEHIKQFRTDGYLHIARNVLRYGWLLTLLFGATPAMCTTYHKNDKDELTPANRHTVHGPWATSLRNSKYGYQSTAQQNLFISFSSLSEYCRSLACATVTNWPPFHSIPSSPPRKQINSSILQIENEYYSPIRPKQASVNTARLTTGLLQQGIEYLEIRSSDIDPFCPWGITKEQILFTESFILACLLLESPPITPEQMIKIKENNETIAIEGRNPQSTVWHNGKIQSVIESATDIMEAVKIAAEIHTKASGSPEHTESHETQALKLTDFTLLPSSKVLQLIKTNREFFFVSMKQTSDAMKEIRSHNPNNERIKELEKSVTASWELLSKLKPSEEASFESYIKEQTDLPPDHGEQLS